MTAFPAEADLGGTPTQGTFKQAIKDLLNATKERLVTGSSPILADQIDEVTAGHGVQVDNLLIKDGGFSSSLAAAVSGVLKSSGSSAIFTADGATGQLAEYRLRENSVTRARLVWDGSSDELLLRWVDTDGTTVKSSLSMYTGDAVFNEAGADINFRVESDLNANAINMDGGLESLGLFRAPVAANAIELGKVLDLFNGLKFSGGDVLSEYDEGTWTPTLIGATSAGAHTYTTQSATYTRIGNIVRCTFWIQVNGAFGGTGNLRLGGLPFTASATADSGIAWAYVDGVSLGSGFAPMGYADSNQTYCSLFRSTITGMSNWTDAQVGTNCRLQGTVWYQI